MRNCYESRFANLVYLVNKCLAELIQLHSDVYNTSPTVYNNYLLAKTLISCIKVLTNYIVLKI